MKRPVLVTGALLGAAAAGAVTAVAVTGGAAPAGAAAPPPVTVATVVRTNLATSVLTAGTLGYAPAPPVVNQLTGTYTALPQPGTVIRPGQVLYRVDDQPAVLLQGTTPAWRAFTAGMIGGPDVTELQRNLIRLGYATGLFSKPTGQFDWLTADAVIRWQHAAGYPATGQINLGQVVFLPGPVVAGAQNAAPGQPATAGQSPYQVTATTRVITVAATQNLPAVTVGEAVTVILPSGTTTPATITAIGPPPPDTTSSTSGSGSGGSGQQSAASTVLTISPSRPGATGTGQDITVQVSVTTQSVRDVLAVPVSALLALAGGGYGVEVVEPFGARRLTGVTTGLFASTLVQVSGPGIRPGVKVVTAQ